MAFAAKIATTSVDILDQRSLNTSLWPIHFLYLPFIVWHETVNGPFPSTAEDMI